MIDTMPAETKVVENVLALCVERTFDMSEIRRIMTAPEVYSHISDDNSPAREDFQPVDDGRIIYIAISEKDGPMQGVFMCVPQNSICLEVHTCLTAPLFGRSVEAAMRSLDWVWENTGFQRIFTNVPAYNSLAHRLAKRAGMLLFGINQHSFLKNGKLHDQLMLGLNRGGVCQQP